MQAIDDLGLQTRVVVQDCDIMRRRGAPLPSFLKGTPTLVHRRDLRMFEGTRALMQLPNLAVTTPVQSNAPEPDKPPTSAR